MYELGQMVYDTIIRYMDDRHNLTPEIEKAMSVFDHMTGWQDAFNHAAYDTEAAVSEATYYLSDPTGKTKGTRAVHAERPFMGEKVQTFNIQEIFERTVCLLTPERYRRLRRLAVEMDCNSLLELIDHLIDGASTEEELRELRRDFEDDDRSEYGRKPTKQPYRRHKNKDKDKMEQDWRPFGEEW